ncbi:transporter substrate-binding domain-containing protein [Rhodopila sp.]|uniref:transporter substrate-binding domain-containing protein n=1 Tax=Rhodopila sp. TaxID=2480087 RepID=UPI003D109FE4
MTHRPTRRALAAGAAALPATFFIGSAQAQSTAQSTLERVSQGNQLRIAVVSGSPPYFRRDVATGEWTGAAIEMARGIASVWSAKVVFVESTFGNSVLDLQSNKIDIAFALNPTPQRALAIGFTRPYIVAPFGCLAKAGFAPKTWGDLNKSDVRIAFDLGSLHETCARRFAPKARLTGFKSIDDCVLALQSGRVDAQVIAATIGLSTVGRNPSLGPFHLLNTPIVSLPSCYGIQREPDTRFVEVVNAWIDFNRGIGTIREQMIAGLALNGVTPEQVPAELSF